MIRRGGHIGLILLTLGLALTILSFPVTATDNAKWFVCKYVTTPGEGEILQTGDNPISVSESAIKVSPVVAGAIFADGQGRSLVLVEDSGQPEPPVRDDCPPTLPPNPTPTPTPSPSPSPSPTPSPSPSPSPSASPPQGALFSVTTCPSAATASTSFTAGIHALVVPDGMSSIRIRVLRAALVISVLNVRIDGQLLELDEVLADGTIGDLIVSPGTHAWSISNQADTEVLASGVIDCPVCNAAAASPPPATTPSVPDTAMSSWSGIAFAAGGILMALGLLLLMNAAAVARRR